MSKIVSVAVNVSKANNNGYILRVQTQDVPQGVWSKWYPDEASLGSDAKALGLADVVSVIPRGLCATIRRCFKSEAQIDPDTLIRFSFRSGSNA